MVLVLNAVSKYQKAYLSNSSDGYERSLALKKEVINSVVTNQGALIDTVISYLKSKGEVKSYDSPSIKEGISRWGASLFSGHSTKLKNTVIQELDKIPQCGCVSTTNISLN